MKCIGCNTIKKYPICDKCSKKPFLVEKCRQVLAKENKIKELKKLYLNSYADIKDINTAKFWDKKLKDIELIIDQDGMTRDRIATAIQFLPKNAKVVLDIGVGHGYLEEYLSKISKVKVFGNDFSSEAIKSIKKRFTGKYEVMSIYQLEYKKKFDVIFILEVLEHIPPHKVLKVIKNIVSLLNPKGTLIVSVPMNEGLQSMHDNPNGHVREYSKDLIKAELELSGVKVEKFKTFYAFPKHYLLKKMISSLVKNKWQPNNIILKAVKL